MCSSFSPYAHGAMPSSAQNAVQFSPFLPAFRPAKNISLFAAKNRECNDKNAERKASIGGSIYESNWHCQTD